MHPTARTAAHIDRRRIMVSGEKRSFWYDTEKEKNNWEKRPQPGTVARRRVGCVYVFSCRGGKKTVFSQKQSITPQQQQQRCYRFDSPSIACDAQVVAHTRNSATDGWPGRDRKQYCTRERCGKLSLAPPPSFSPPLHPLTVILPRSRSCNTMPPPSTANYTRVSMLRVYA